MKKKTKITLLSGAVVVGLAGATYAFMHSTTYKTNHFQVGDLKIGVITTGPSTFQLAPAQSEEHLLAVENRGTIPTFIRVQVPEQSLRFEVDITDHSGNGDVVLLEDVSPDTVNRMDPTDWESVANAKGTYTIDYAGGTTRTYQVEGYASSTMTLPSLNDPKTDAWAWAKPDFSGMDSGDWLYEGGWFYYVHPMISGETSVPLFNTIRLDAKTPNNLKGSLLAFGANAEGVDLSDIGIESWFNDPSASSVYAKLDEERTAFNAPFVETAGEVE